MKKPNSPIATKSATVRTGKALKSLRLRVQAHTRASARRKQATRDSH